MISATYPPKKFHERRVSIFCPFPHSRYTLRGIEYQRRVDPPSALSTDNFGSTAQSFLRSALRVFQHHRARPFLFNYLIRLGLSPILCDEFSKLFFIIRDTLGT